MDLSLGKNASGRKWPSAGFSSPSRHALRCLGILENHLLSLVIDSSGPCRGVILSGMTSKKISWAIVDYLGAIGMAIGTCLYNVSCTTPAVLVCFDKYYFTHSRPAELHDP